MIAKLFHKCLWLSAAAIFCLVWGFLIEPTQLKIRQHSVDIDNWAKDPIKVVFLADIHFAGEHVSANRVADIVATVNAQAPDLILIGGDFIDGHAPRAKTKAAFDKEVDESFKNISKLEATLGVVSVIGNHDVWYDAAYVTHKLSEAGIQVLDNTHLELGNNICIVGYADDMTQIPDEAAGDGCQDRHTIISLMHSPDTFSLLGRSDLAFAGHTHGGQINIPLIGRRMTATQLGMPFAYGLKEFQGIPVYVTSGIGTSVLPARFRSPPEVVVFTLH